MCRAYRVYREGLQGFLGFQVFLGFLGAGRVLGCFRVFGFQGCRAFGVLGL